MKPKINILFPIETINRELDFRLMLAGVCARKEFRFILGNTKALWQLVQNQRGGLYVGKHILYGRFPNASQEQYETLKRNDFSYVHLDEEGAVHPGGEEEWKRIFDYTLDPRFLKAEDHICTWGDWQRDYYSSYQPAPACRENIVTTGHPRFDLYKPRYREYFARDADVLREKYGNFVLMNTNFTFVNRARTSDGAFSAKYFYEPKNPGKRLDQIRRWTHISHILANFIQLAARISVEFSELNVIIRPHPSEDRTLYDKIFAEVPNVHVEHTGSVGSWLSAARCLIHDGCTTALEAHFCDTPIINYKSEIQTRYDKFLPNLFGFQEREENAAIARLDEILKASTLLVHEVPTDERALSLLENFRSDAFEKLGAVIVEKAEQLQPREYSLPVRRAFIGRAVKNRLVKQKEKSNSGRIVEFYGFENTGLDAKMQMVQSILDKELKYTLLSSDLMSIEA